MSKTQSVYYPLYNDKEKFIILVTGGRGCERPDQEVIMADMTIKQIKDIKVGDKVMGDDGTPRNVLRTYHGYSEMYRVHQTNAEDYYVNDGHILSIRKGRGIYSEGRYPDKGDKIDINIQEFLKQSKNFRERWYGYKANSIPYKEQPVKIDPYMLGVWLGDGTSVYPQITTPDKEIKDYLQEYAAKNGMVLSLNGKKGKAETLRLKKKGCHDNPFMEKLRFYNLVGNKHIPQEYIANSEEVRLELLAGLLDTDGCMDGNGYEITQKKEILARQIKLIADTLGFRTSLRTRRAKIYEKDCGIVYRLSINGDVWRIPCKIARKKVYPHKRKDWLVSKLTIEPVGNGEWYGIHLDGNQRYLHADGTVSHNSGKSYNTSRFIERLTFEYNPEKKLAHQILYTRFTMVSAAISVIPEFWEKVEVDNTEEYFSKTKTDVVNNMTKARVMFRGIHTSSGNQTAKLKSIQGVTTFVVDEAEEWVSEEEFEKIMLSIRVKGLQNRVIIIMNPCDSNHWVYKRFIKDTHKIEYFDGVPVQISTHPNVLHIHTTYLDNINNLSEQFLKEVLDMKVKNPQRYAHIVMGQWADVAEGAVFKKWGIVDEFPPYAKKIARAQDLGYTNDPTAIVRCGIIDNRLYVDELCFRTGMTSGDIIRELRQEADRGDDGFVYSESADPRLIDEITLGGVVIYPVQKSAGSVLAGLSKMLDMEIYVTKRSVNLQEELRNYVYAKDKFGNYTNMPEDHDNHCFTADTLVTTDCGDKRIADLQIGDMVLTSVGYREVINFFNNGIKEVWERTIKLGDTSVTIKATPDHKFKTTKGWVQYKDLKIGDVLYYHSDGIGEYAITDIIEHRRFNAEVFDITVDEIHEFLANGIIVSNCIDAIRYYVLGCIEGKIMHPKRVTKQELGVY